MLMLTLFYSRLVVMEQKIFPLLFLLIKQKKLLQKLPLPQVMIQTAAWLFMAGMASYVALYYLKGDGVAFLVETLKAELAAVEEVSTEVYDMMLSLLSANGYLPDVDEHVVSHSKLFSVSGGDSLRMGAIATRADDLYNQVYKLLQLEKRIAAAEDGQSA